MTMKDPLANPTLRGSKYRATSKASVTAILGEDTRPVSSRGSRFYNKDSWTGRKLLAVMCEWAHKNAGCVPTRAQVEQWVFEANRESVHNPEIVIANTPEKLDLRTANALIGGCYHEAFHTLYSCRRQIAVREACDIILPRWAKVIDWSRYFKLLKEWSNVDEDIRIERLGCKEFPGVHTKLCDLQDFVLQMEEEGRESARSHGVEPNT